MQVPITRHIVCCVAALILSACGDDGDRITQAPPVVIAPIGSAMVANDWQITNATDYKSGPSPQEHSEGWVFDIPQVVGSAHAVTFVHGPLTGKTRITLRYRIEMAEGVRIVPRKEPSAPSILSLYFQRRGDNWSAAGQYETYRWYSSFRLHMPIVAGEHELTARLDENWTAVLTSSRETNPAGFQSAIDNAERVGFVLGGGDGLAHGVYATGPAKLIVTEFRVE